MESVLVAPERKGGLGWARLLLGQVQGRRGEVEAAQENLILSLKQGVLKKYGCAELADGCRRGDLVDIVSGGLLGEGERERAGCLRERMDDGGAG